MDRDQNPELMNAIHDILAKHPGLYLSRLADLLHVNIWMIEKQLYFMKKKGDVFCLNDMGYSRYYINEIIIDSHHDRRTNLTRKKTLHLIEENPGMHLSKIAERLNMSIQLARYHIYYLESKKLITSKKFD